jgi:1-acyl-sn-glycerol-3-phosphate acyltransferase
MKGKKEKKKIFQIDVEKVIRNQENETVRNLPRPVISFIKYLIKEKDLNELLIKIGDKKNFDFVEAAIKALDLKIKVEGAENIPDDPNVIFVGNHALGGVDFLALIHAIRHKHKMVNHLTNDVLMSIKPLEEMMVPVNVFGKNPREYQRLYDKRLKDPHKPVTIFPSGEVARMYRGKWDDGIWRSGFVRFAKKFNKKVVPFFITTRNSPWFYRIERWRKKLGIKANLELFLLPRQIFYQKGKTIHIIFGEPISPDTFDETKTIHQWADWVKRKAYSLPAKYKKSEE